MRTENVKRWCIKLFIKQQTSGMNIFHQYTQDSRVICLSYIHLPLARGTTVISTSQMGMWELPVLCQVYITDTVTLSLSNPL